MFQFIWLCHDKISTVEVPHQTFVQENGVAKGYADVLRDSSADLGIVSLGN
jgi:cellobiose phosphorylase